MWEALERMGVRFLRGQLVLIAAGPGCGKSGLALTLSLKSRLPSLLFSADSDAFTQLQRSISIETGVPLSTAADIARAPELPGEVRAALGNIPLRIDYDASPSTDDIEEIVEAYWELYGEYPTIITVDNITNVRTEDAEGSEALEILMDYLHGMARATGACVIGLHHVTGEFNNSDKPIPLSGVKGQIGRVPEMILTLHKPREGVLCVSPVKHRGGKADPSGQTYAELRFEGDHMAITDFAFHYGGDEW
ncbi:AAA family ATPase [Saccharothrix sp. HUAS TT1]|uniref:DnaB-like helicase C-terminal domain-containing protein n=1 Tax=unclassified Saccharothrix TaxID=2593673 RepID=UPI00345C1828